MGEYSKYISTKRRSVATPKSMVNNDRSCVFGTFDKEFEDMGTIGVRSCYLHYSLNHGKDCEWPVL